MAVDEDVVDEEHCPWLSDAIAAFLALEDGQYLWICGADFSSKAWFARHVKAHLGWDECCCCVDVENPILPAVQHTCDAFNEAPVGVCLDLLYLDVNVIDFVKVREALHSVRDGWRYVDSGVSVDRRHLIVMSYWKPPPTVVTNKCVVMAV